MSSPHLNGSYYPAGSPPLFSWNENISDAPAWCFAVQEPHQVFEGKDPYWSPKVIKAAREQGFEADDQGRMIKPPNFDQLNAQLLEEMYNA